AKNPDPLLFGITPAAPAVEVTHELTASSAIVLGLLSGFQRPNHVPHPAWNAVATRGGLGF
ncbi:MAG TPA: hypothetical protein VE618_08935, partial [Myxococcaceae bacterium]|nr:hypothetical protein [Myxococcaceae bacterium]